MERKNKIPGVMKWLGAATLAIGFMAQPAQANTQSAQIAFIQSQNVVTGGSFPFGQADFVAAGFQFHQMLYTANFATSLAPGGVCGASACDTVLLNVTSSGFTCNVNGLLGAQQKADLLAFVNNGGKLIIYDSECTSQNYNWLPYPFTTNNPGARGGRGTVHIVEDNGLSTKVGDPSCTSGDPLCINATTLGANTDAVGDMNVMTTFNPNWCLDMSGTNSLQQTGPTHTYARYGSGLIIYNGFDLDVLTSSTAPVNTVPAGNLSKIFFQELKVAFNPTPLAVLPCGVGVVGIAQTPLNAINDLASGQTTHTVTANLEDNTGAPQVGITVSFSVIAGPNAGASGTCSVNFNCTTDATGHVSFTYASNGNTGIDTIHTCFTNQAGQQVCAQDAKKEWIRTQQAICDVDSDGDVDKIDLSIISRSRGQTVPPGDPRDSDGDGVITPNDVKVCIPLCTRAGCAIQ